MSYGDTKIVINSITYDNCSNNILVGVRKHPETEDSQTAEVVLQNADKRFTDLNLKGLTAVISYDYGSGYTATPTLTVVTQDDITSGGHYQTVLSLVGIPDLLADDKASKDYVHDSTDTKAVKALITEVLDGTPVPSSLTAEQTTMGSYSNLDGDMVGVGQALFIRQRTVKTIQFSLKKVGSPTGNITFYMRPTDLSWTESKVLGDASTLSTSVAWKTATLDTPKYVDDQVYIYCEYTDGDISNYVAVGFSSSGVVEGENLVRLYGSVGFSEITDQDCGYKYTYDIAGVDCFSHCTSITATFDSEDALIDVYAPGDSFKISEGESRLDVVNRLLDYTACYKRAEDDAEIHIFTIPASGNSYTSATGDFYNHVNRKALVIPNKIVVKSYDDDDGFTGSATSAASYALKPITGVPVRAYVSGTTQANALAAAIITRLEVNSQSGSALVPMVNYEQIWNYVTATNTWNGSTTTGNITYLNRVSMGGKFEQFFSFGQQAKRGIAGGTPRREVKLEPVFGDDTLLKWGMIKGLFDTIDEETDVLYWALEQMGVKVERVDRGVTFEWAYNAILSLISGPDIVPLIKGNKIYIYSGSTVVGEIGYDTDTFYILAKTGQNLSITGANGNRFYLGSDGSVEVLSGNSKDIDINSDNDIVDFHGATLSNVVDPGNAQDATTKNYVDGKLDDVSVSEPSRAIDTVYQNTSGKIMLVTVTVGCLAGNELSCSVFTDGSNPPTTRRAVVQTSDSTGSVYTPVTFIVLPSHYYKIYNALDTVILEWHEWLLH